MTLLVIVLPIVVAIVTALGAWAVARVTNSGDIDTSDAETLWAEATKMRAAYQAETEQHRAEAQELRREIEDCRLEIRALRTELQSLRTENIALRADASTMREEAIELCREVSSRGQLAALLLASGLYGEQHGEGHGANPGVVPPATGG